MEEEQLRSRCKVEPTIRTKVSDVLPECRDESLLELQSVEQFEGQKLEHSQLWRSQFEVSFKLLVPVLIPLIEYSPISSRVIAASSVSLRFPSDFARSNSPPGEFPFTVVVEG